MFLRAYIFDGGIRDIFGALLNGGALLPLDIETEGVTHLHERLRCKGITICRAVITALRRFARNSNRQEEFPRLLAQT
jgi:hypothetical protein